MNLKITTKTLSKISLIINKMGISNLIMDLNVETGNEDKDKELLVKRLLSLIIDNMYKAENEIVELIATTKGISEEEAQEEDVVEFIKELFRIDKIQSFLK